MAEISPVPQSSKRTNLRSTRVSRVRITLRQSADGQVIDLISATTNQALRLLLIHNMLQAGMFAWQRSPLSLEQLATEAADGTGDHTIHIRVYEDRSPQLFELCNSTPALAKNILFRRLLRDGAAAIKQSGGLLYRGDASSTPGASAHQLPQAQTPVSPATPQLPASRPASTVHPVTAPTSTRRPPLPVSGTPRGLTDLDTNEDEHLGA